MKKLLLSSFLFGCFLLASGQTTETDQNAENLTIDQQFEELYRKSGNYQEYEVAKKSWLLDLQKNISDSIAALQTQVNDFQNQLSTQTAQIADLQNSNSDLTKQLTDTQQAQNSIGFLGFLDMHKNAYRFVMWSLIIVVSGLFFFYLARFKQSHVHTRNAQEALKNLEEEFDSYRARAMEREQKAMRRLQDEINKNKYSNTAKK
ncbi:MAG: hypothetical protein RQ735_01045 [Flavobacteriaceae bacterium]|nr:hypothetical protein [Flavobacteriaceae bacterium]